MDYFICIVLGDHTYKVNIMYNSDKSKGIEYNDVSSVAEIVDFISKFLIDNKDTKSIIICNKSSYINIKEEIFEPIAKTFQFATGKNPNFLTKIIL